MQSNSKEGWTTVSYKQNNINQNLKKLENDSDDEDNLKPKIKTVNLNLQIKIQQQRTQLNMTQKELAKKCNLLLSDIQDLENGKTLLDQNKINKVSKVLGISLSNK